MRAMVCAGVVCLALLTPGITLAQIASVSEPAQEGAVPLARLIATVAKKTSKRFIVDPRVRADVLLVGQDPASVTYADLLEILHVHAFAAIEGGGYIRVIPDASVRWEGLPVISGKDSHVDAEWVSKVIQVHNTPAVQLVPLLRPILPQQAHLVAYPCANVLVILGTVANVRQIEALLPALDVGQPYKADKCEAPPPAPPRRDN